MDRRLLALAMGTFAIGTDSFVVAGILPDVGQSLGVSILAAGQMITVYALTYAVMTPIMAALTAHWPRRRVLLGGLAVFSLGNILTAVLPSFHLVLVSRALAGLGGAIFTPTASGTAALLVPPERRGRALAIVVAGLSGAIALGAPLGTAVASLGDWRLSMGFVTVLGMLAAAGIVAALPAVPATAALRLRDRLAPLGDARVALTLLTTLLVLTGVFMVYSYISVAFDRATGGDGAVLAGLIAVFGIASTAGNLMAGHLTDRFGNRRVLNLAILIVAADFVLMPWSSASLTGAAAALVIWGLSGWAVTIAQQHRLVNLMPATAPIVLALNSSTIYVGVSISGVAGALAIQAVGPHQLGTLGALLIVAGLLTAELAHARIRRRRDPTVRCPVLTPQPEAGD